MRRAMGGASPTPAALREQAQAMKVDWNVVLQADAADHGSRHWVNLQRLVQRAVPTVRAALLNSPSPILLVCVGLLARYGLMSLVTEGAGRDVPTVADGKPHVLQGVDMRFVTINVSEQGDVIVGLGAREVRLEP